MRCVKAQEGLLHQEKVCFACLHEHVGVWSCLFRQLQYGPYENAKPKYNAKDAIRSKHLHKKIIFRGEARYMVGFRLKCI